MSANEVAYENNPPATPAVAFRWQKQRSENDSYMRLMGHIAFVNVMLACSVIGLVCVLSYDFHSHYGRVNDDSENSTVYHRVGIGTAPPAPQYFGGTFPVARTQHVFRGTVTLSPNEHVGITIPDAYDAREDCSFYQEGGRMWYDKLPHKFYIGNMSSEPITITYGCRSERL